jgi:hypothetical protein
LPENVAGAYAKPTISTVSTPEPSARLMVSPISTIVISRPAERPKRGWMM